MSDLDQKYPLSKRGMNALKTILYEYHTHPSDSMDQLEDTIIIIECRIRDLNQLNKEGALSKDDALLLKILIMMKDDLDKLWTQVYRAFEDVRGILDSLDAAYFEEEIADHAFHDYLKEVDA